MRFLNEFKGTELIKDLITGLAITKFPHTFRIGVDE